MVNAKIIGAKEHGTMWQLLYEVEGGGIDSTYFDHRPFAEFYEAATGRSFFKDSGYGHGRRFISGKLQDICIRVHGDNYEQMVCLADQVAGGENA